MKGFLIAFMFLAFVMFNPTSTLARIVKEEKDIRADKTPISRCSTNGSGCRTCLPPSPAQSTCTHPYKHNCL
ncbi:hypothetical protein Fmac_017400 [Flemingia macrophylla]|uniref:Uncharacterized protein n=1 Tax=Flemingia macrophylla TaxID=520843 RepID=A0ABD1M202_9FABA